MDAKYRRSTHQDNTPALPSCPVAAARKLADIPLLRQITAMSEAANGRDKRMQNWKNITEWLVVAAKQLPEVWPSELPPEGTKDFWFTACRFEMQTRQEVSARIRLMFRGEEMGDVLPLESWFFRRRLEWAGQMALAAVQKNLPPGDTAEETLEHLLVESWETSGCIGMWYHAEREGNSHPENPDGLTPLGPR